MIACKTHIKNVNLEASQLQQLQTDAKSSTNLSNICKTVNDCVLQNADEVIYVNSYLFFAKVNQATQRPPVRG